MIRADGAKFAHAAALTQLAALDRTSSITLLVNMHNDGEIAVEAARFRRLAKQEVGLTLR